MAAELLPDPLYDLDTLGHLEVEEPCFQAGVGLDIRKDEVRLRSVDMIQYEASNLRVGGIHFDLNVLDVRFPLRVHPNDPRSVEKRLPRQLLKFSELIAEIRPPDQKHEWHPLIKRLLHSFLSYLPVRRDIEINVFPVRNELLVRSRVVPSHLTRL